MLTLNLFWEFEADLTFLEHESFFSTGTNICSFLLLLPQVLGIHPLSVTILLLAGFQSCLFNDMGK